MKICDNCDRKDICTVRTRCEPYKAQKRKLDSLQISVLQWERFEREWQQVTDTLKKFVRGGNKHGTKTKTQRD